MKRIKLNTNRRAETRLKKLLLAMVKNADKNRFTDSEYSDFQNYLLDLEKMKDINEDEVREELLKIANSMLESSFAVLGLELVETPQRITKYIDMWIDTNVLLIESLTTDCIKSIQIAISDGISNGSNIQKIQKDILSKVNIAKARAELIAITETAKAMSNINRSNLIDLKVEWVIWSSSNDKRTRPCHRARDGKKYDITKGCYSACDGKNLQVGMEIRCRCAMVVVL